MVQRVVDPTIERRIAILLCRLEQLHAGIYNTNLVPSTTIDFKPLWAKAALANNKESEKTAMFERLGCLISERVVESTKLKQANAIFMNFQVPENQGNGKPDFNLPYIHIIRG
jgi:hypothetical protein